MSFHRIAKQGAIPQEKQPKKSAAMEAMLSAKDRIRGGADDCWLWPGDKFNGYGIIGHKVVKGMQQPYRAHRLSFEFHKGRIPWGLVVMHACDRPACFNPNHLFLGTPSDNMQDMVRKARNRGARNSPGMQPQHKEQATIMTSDAEDVMNAAYGQKWRK